MYQSKTALGFLLASFVCVSVNTTEARGRSAEPQLTVLKGHCDDQSYIAEGPEGSDITKRQSRFFCDSAVMTASNDDPARVLITFAESKAHIVRQVAFAGAYGEANMIDVSRVYLEPGKATALDEGMCNITRKSGQIKTLFCGAKINQGGRRAITIVVFRVGMEEQSSTEKARSVSRPHADSSNGAIMDKKDSGATSVDSSGVAAKNEQKSVSSNSNKSKFAGLKHNAVDICYGEFTKDTCPISNSHCNNPKKAGAISGFMGWSIEEGQKVYQIYRINAYPAANIRLESNCRLPFN